jgi:transcription initiation factor TFIID subunit 10
MSNTPAAFAYPISSAYSTATAEASQTTSQAGASSTQPAAQQSRQAAEEARKDRTLAEFMLMLDEYEPLVLS